MLDFRGLQDQNVVIVRGCHHQREKKSKSGGLCCWVGQKAGEKAKQLTARDIVAIFSEIGN
jgi:hypothetical protein